jgi:uncharacterized repeat protein (TIGR01451 family)
MNGRSAGRGGSRRIARRWVAAGLTGTAALAVILLGGSISGAAPPTGSADVSVTKSDNPDPVQAGGKVTYTISVKNAGPDAATDVVVTDRLPKGATFIKASSSAGTCTEAMGTVTCNLGTIGAAEGSNTATVKICLHAPATAGTISDTATVATTAKDTNHRNNSASETTSVSGTKPAPKPTCHGRKATLVGTPGDDTLVGKKGADVVVAGGGNDHVRTLSGRDIVCAGRGDDVVAAGADADFVRGGRGADRLRGRGGNDRLHGNRGPDHLRGGRGDDLLAGGRGRDRCKGGPGRDTTRSC